jgi:hypothetical protein
MLSSHGFGEIACDHPQTLEIHAFLANAAQIARRKHVHQHTI